MVKELELFGLDGASGWFARTKKEFHLEPGQKCRNCDTELAGRYCHVCSQDADTHHRTIGHLIFEGFEGLFHLDGRIWQTLPPLFFRPGQLNRDLMEGRIARHVPPFRLFLVALLIFMFAAEHKTEELRHQANAATHGAQAEHTQSAHTAAADGPDIDIHAPASQSAEDEEDPITRSLGQVAEHQGTVTTVTHADGSKTTTRNVQLFAMSEADSHRLAEAVKESGMQPQWLKADLVKALENPDGFIHGIFTWGHRLALLLLPIVGLLLGLLYSGKRHQRFFLYDHLLVAMNLLSFMFFTMAVGFVVPDVVMEPWGHLLFFVWTLANFFMTLRGAYGSSIIGATLKTAVLWLMTMFSFSLVLAGVMFVSLAA